MRLAATETGSLGPSGSGPPRTAHDHVIVAG